MWWLRLPWMILFAISLHWVYGAGLILWGSQDAAIPLLGGYQQPIDYVGVVATGWMLLIVATIALFGLVFDRWFCRWLSLALLAPQYFVLLLALGACADLIVNGYTATTSSGRVVTVDRQVILVALAPIFLASFWHTLAILQRVIDPQTPEKAK